MKQRWKVGADGRRRRSYPIKCLQCKKKFFLTASRLKKQKFCSPLCGWKASRKIWLKVNCAFCKKKFEVSAARYKKSRKTKSKLAFCSVKCLNFGRRIGGVLKIKSHKGGVASSRKIAFRIHLHKCNRCGWKVYPQVLEVHHRNRNRSDNSSLNTEILCPNCHSIEHFLARDGRWYKKSRSNTMVVSSSEKREKSVRF